MTTSLLIAAGALSHITVGVAMYVLGHRRGARRRPPQRVRVELPPRELTGPSRTGRHGSRR